MESIINPAWFYWIDVINTFRIFLCGVSIFFGIAWFILLCAFIACSLDGTYNKNKTDSYIKFFIVSFIVLVTAIIISIFIPSKETMEKMIIANYITKNNLEKTVDAVKQAIDYITEALK